MGPMVGLPLPNFIHPDHNVTAFAVLQLILTLPIVYIGRSFYTVGFKALIKGHPNMDSLIAIGTSAAILQGIVMTVLLATGKIVVHQGHHPDLYFEISRGYLGINHIRKIFGSSVKRQNVRSNKKTNGFSTKNRSCYSSRPRS